MRRSRVRLVRLVRLVVVVLLVATSTACGTQQAKAPSPPQTKLVLQLGGDAETPSDCRPITVRRLAKQDFAFSGTLDLQKPDDLWWVFTVDHWYRGGNQDVVVATGGDVSSVYFAQVVGGKKEGGRYLVTGTKASGKPKFKTDPKGSTSACSTRLWNERLAKLYAKAFPE